MDGEDVQEWSDIDPNRDSLVYWLKQIPHSLGLISSAGKKMVLPDKWVHAQIVL